MSDDATRRAMHVLLDMVASQDLESPAHLNLLAGKTAFQGFDQDAIRVTEDDETGELSVDPTPLLTAAGMAIQSLLGIVAIEKQQDELTVLNVLRQHLDTLLSDDTTA